MVDNFSKYGWCILLKRERAQTVKHEFSKLMRISKPKPELFETNDGKEVVNKVFNKFLELDEMKRYSRYTSNRAVFAERFIGSIRNLLKNPVFEKRFAYCKSELPSVTEKYNNSKPHSTKMTPIEASKKINEKTICFSLRDERQKRKLKYEIMGLVGAADAQRLSAKEILQIVVKNSVQKPQKRKMQVEAIKQTNCLKDEIKNC